MEIEKIRKIAYILNDKFPKKDKSDDGTKNKDTSEDESKIKKEKIKKEYV